MAGEKDEKTEDPTGGKRLNDARSEGKVGQSKELPGAITLLVMTFFFLFLRTIPHAGNGGAFSA